MSEEATKKETTDFIRTRIREDIASGKDGGKVVTRFPPEPNGYLHIGHAKAIGIDFGIALDFNGKCNLRLDDTNPCKEETEYVEAIKTDIRWLGYSWNGNEFYASDYYPALYDFAVQLIKKGKAYVDSLNADEVREHRGTPTMPGKNSPYRERSVEENLQLFEKMKAGEFKEGEHFLRAKIDMASPNINMRDPAMYRIRFEHHHRTGDDWCIYPMYDYAHPLSDMLEGITHSLCSLEFEDHRPLYDWFLNELDTPCKPRQIEFARLNITHTVMSKRKLLQLVKEKYVSGWSDPRMPTLSGLRRRGYSPEAIRMLVEKTGISKANSTVDIAFLEYCLREDLNKKAPRRMAVLRPLKLIVDNYPENQVEELDAENNPEDEAAGKRKMPFSKELYIEQDDFMEDAPKQWFRLSPGKEVRLKHAYYVTCTSVVKDSSGNVSEIHCTYDPETKGGWSTDGRKVKGTLHWVSAAQALNAEVRLYDHLFSEEFPENAAEGKTFLDFLNPNSIETLTNCKLEPSLAQAASGENFQFLRLGYFCVDSVDSKPSSLVFNRSVGLRDTWAKVAQKS